MTSLKECITAVSVFKSRAGKEVSRRNFLKTVGVCLTASAATVAVSEAAQKQQPGVQEPNGYFPWMGP